MSVPFPLLRRRTSSHGETERKAFLYDDIEGEEGFRRRVVSFTSPETRDNNNTTTINRTRGHSEHRNGDHEHRYGGPKGGILQRSHGINSSGEDIPDGVTRSKKGGSGGEDVPDGGGGGGIGGFRRRLKSLSFGISLSPGTSSHDLRHVPETIVGGGSSAGSAGGGGIVNSMVRRSLLQAVWPLSVSLENIEGHYHPLQQHR
ncbi:hypothetical protein Pmani_020219 [Petrolisthes manimaculis]|uniref:Uncharacterized protein n=1 Tax=Petrolisthes manimaculis TaxID=1843537 RepID=A0AAE1U6L6_9EUCA|nr:hypothetical protein Pmani_020219 [Petrolisthes manimaculis]